MLLPDNFAEQLSESLSKADHRYLHQVSSVLLDPVNFARVYLQIQNVHLIFSLCFALKERIKERNSVSCLFSTETAAREKNSGKLEQNQKIACFNPLFVFIKEKSSCSIEKKSQMPLKSCSSNDGCLDYFFWDTNDQAHARLYWYESINYLELLLTSLKRTYEIDPRTENEKNWLDGTSKMRDEIIGKLMMECLSYSSQGDLRLVSFEWLMNYAQSCLPSKFEIIYDKLIGIIFQAASYLSSELQGYSQMKVFEKHGESIISFILALFQRLNASSERSFLLKVRLIQSIYELLVIPFTEDQKCQFFDAEQSSEELALNEGEKFPSWLRPYNCKIIELVQSVLGSKEVFFCQQHLIVKMLGVIRLVSKNQMLVNFSSALLGKSKNCSISLFKVACDIFSVLRGVVDLSRKKLETCLFQGPDQINFYLQFCIIRTLYSILTVRIDLAIKQASLLDMLLEHYFPLILIKVPIKTGSGQKNPISMLSILLKKIYPAAFKKTDLMKQYVSLFFAKCVTEKYEECFSRFDQEVECSSEYFFPVIRLLEEIEGKRFTESGHSHVVLIRKQVQNVFINEYKSNAYLIQLAVQLVRGMLLSVRQSDRAEISELALYLMQNLKFSAYKTEYLMLLEVMADLIIEENSQNLNSEFWYYLKKKVSLSLPALVSQIMSEMISLLLAPKSQYYVSSIVDTLSRTYKKFNALDASVLVSEIIGKNIPKRKSSSKALLRIYFEPVYELVSSLQNSVLQNLTHFEERKKIFELIGLFMVTGMEEMYYVYNKFIFSKHNLQTEEGLICFFTDISGLLRAEMSNVCKQTLFELILLQVEGSNHVLSLFSLSNLKENQLCFRLCISFLYDFLNCWSSVNHQTYYLCKKIKCLIAQIVKTLPQLYDSGTYKDISKIYQSFKRLVSMQIGLPSLPDKIYYSQNSFPPAMIRLYLDSLNISNRSDQLVSIYTNIYERRGMDWTFEQKESGLCDEIFSTSEKIEILLYFCDVFERTKIQSFFDYNKLIKSLASDLYGEFVERYSLKSFDLGSFDDTDNEVDPVNYVEALFKGRLEIRLLRKLAQSQYNFNLLSGQNMSEYSQFQFLFFQGLKCWFYGLKVTKK